MLLDTYRTFGCESSEPTFRYSLTDGVSDPDGPFLVNPETVKILTEISTQLLSDEGLAVHKITDESEETDETFDIKDYERKFFNHGTLLPKQLYHPQIPTTMRIWRWFFSFSEKKRYRCCELFEVV